jgi:hypothetical protein
VAKGHIRAGEFESLLLSALEDVLVRPKSVLTSGEEVRKVDSNPTRSPVVASFLPSVRRMTPEDVKSFRRKLTKPGITVLEEACVYKYHEEQDWTHQRIADEYGKHRTHITNMIGLLELPRVVLDALASPESGVTMGHARTLKAVKHMPDVVIMLLNRIMEEGRSVRWLDDYIRIGKKNGWQGAVSPQASLDAASQDLSVLIREACATLHAEVEYVKGELRIRTVGPAHAVAILKRLGVKA